MATAAHVRNQIQVGTDIVVKPWCEKNCHIALLETYHTAKDEYLGLHKRSRSGGEAGGPPINNTLQSSSSNRNLT